MAATFLQDGGYASDPYEKFLNGGSALDYDMMDDDSTARTVAVYYNATNIAQYGTLALGVFFLITAIGLVAYYISNVGGGATFGRRSNSYHEPEERIDTSQWLRILEELEAAFALYGMAKPDIGNGSNKPPTLGFPSSNFGGTSSSSAKKANYNSKLKSEGSGSGSGSSLSSSGSACQHRVVCEVYLPSAPEVNPLVAQHISKIIGQLTLSVTEPLRGWERRQAEGLLAAANRGRKKGDCGPYAAGCGGYSLGGLTTISIDKRTHQKQG